MSFQVRLHIKIIAGGIFILSGLLASGCSGKKEVLSEKEMVNLIADLKLAEAYANNNISGHDVSKSREELARSVLAAHNVSQQQLDSTLGWYGHNLDKYAELYEKVDKRLLEKRKKLMKDDVGNSIEMEGDNLWPFAKNGMISSLGNNDGWILSLNEPGIDKGERIVWSMNLKDQTIPLAGVIGVEYSDGTSEANSTYFTTRQKIELSLQVDTGKTVKRLYGSMRLKKEESQPLFVDSISILKLPFDSVEYSRYRSQKKYGYPVRITKEDSRKNVIRDSLMGDSIEKAKDLRKDSLLNNHTTNAAGSVSDKPKRPTAAKPVKPDGMERSKPEANNKLPRKSKRELLNRTK